MLVQAQITTMVLICPHIYAISPRGKLRFTIAGCSSFFECLLNAHFDSSCNYSGCWGVFTQKLALTTLKYHTSWIFPVQDWYYTWAQKKHNKHQTWSASFIYQSFNTIIKPQWWYSPHEHQTSLLLVPTPTLNIRYWNTNSQTSILNHDIPQWSL